MINLRLSILVCAFLLCSCYNSRKARDRERTYTKPYHQEENDLNMQLFLYHFDEATSHLYYKLNSGQLLYKKADTANYFTATLSFQYIFRQYPEAGAILDSGTVRVADKSYEQPVGRDITGYIPLKTAAGVGSYLEIKVMDILSKKNCSRHIYCDKESVYSQQNFLFKNTGGMVVFTNKIDRGNLIGLYNERANFAKVKVDYFPNDYSLPPPPFSQKEPLLYPSVPDATFFIAVPDSHSFVMTVPQRGIYYVRPDTAKNTGCLVLGVEPDFPKVQSHAQMIASSRYIMNKEEYQKLVDAADKQSAIESFWLGIAGNNDRAKELIKRYYNRVQDANRFFTSHMEGWKTDMGMIYIVFGTPGKTYKTNVAETWEYYIQTGAPPLTFRFQKITNPFSENCFKLERNPSYKDPWTIAVSHWREGRVYLED